MKEKNKPKPATSGVRTNQVDIRYSPVIITKSGVLKLRKSKNDKWSTK